MRTGQNAIHERGLRERLYAAFHRPGTPAFRAVEGVVWVLVVGSIGLLAAEAVVTGPLLRLLQRIDLVILALFGLEIAMRVATYRPPELEVFSGAPFGRLRTHLRARLFYLLRPMMLIDIATVLALVPALRGLRALRLLRLFRWPRLFRYANPFGEVVQAFQADRLLFVVAFGSLGLQTVLGGLSLFLVERHANSGIGSVADGLWWALVTITTVGFGDITPVTTLGRIIGGVLMVGGMFTLALFAGIVGHSLLNAVLSIRQEQFRMSSYVNHIVVCGFEEGARMLLGTLARAIDLDERPVVLFADRERPRDLPPPFLWVHGDPTKESELDKIRLTHASTVILAGARSVAPQHADATTILTAFTIRSYLRKRPESVERKRPVQIVAEILDSENVEHARAAGADEVIETRRVGFSLLSNAVGFPGVADAASEVVIAGASNLYVGRVPSDAGTDLTFGKLAQWLRAQHQALVIGIRDPSTGHQRLNPRDDEAVTPSCHVVYLSEKAVLDPP